MHAMVCVMRAEYNQQELVLFFNHVNFSDLAHIIRGGEKCLYLLNHLASPGVFLDLVTYTRGSLFQRGLLDFNAEHIITLSTLMAFRDLFSSLPFATISHSYSSKGHILSFVFCSQPWLP